MESSSIKKVIRRAKQIRYRRNCRTRRLLARAVADLSFILDVTQININLFIARIFLASVAQNTRDSPHFSFPGPFPSYSPVYHTEPDPLIQLYFIFTSIFPLESFLPVSPSWPTFILFICQSILAIHS